MHTVPTAACLLLASGVLASGRAPAQGLARLVRDINQTAPSCNTSSDPIAGTSLAGLVCFHRQHELWRTDGTRAGTFPLVQGQVEASTASNGLVFCTTGSGYGFSLWRADGSPAGTQMLQTFVRSGVNPFQRMGSTGSLLLFEGCDAQNGRELWRSDGTVAGTVLVTDINPGAADAFSVDTWFAGALGQCWFPADDGRHGRELWVSDGTAAGTRLLRDISVSPGSGFELTFLGAWRTWVLFAANDGISGTELWRTDGTTAGTVMVLDIRPGGVSSAPQRLGSTAAGLCFWADDAVHGVEPWITDGTASGTRLVRDVFPGPGSSRLPGVASPEAAALGNDLLFAALDGVNGGELWRTDGTPQGTVLVRDILPGPASSLGGRLLAGPGVVYFMADEGLGGVEPWRSDGTAAGTRRVSDVFPGPTPSWPMPLGMLGSDVLFGAEDGVHGRELWKSDGTGAGTVLVRDMTICPAHADPLTMGDARGTATMYFNAWDGQASGLWRSDGTTAGTSRIGAATNVQNDGFLALVPFRDTTVFTRFPDLWRSDGTAGGTVRIPCGCTPEGSGSMAVAGDFVYFTAWASRGVELWRTDGTTAGTLELDIYPGNTGSYPAGLTAFRRRVWFGADDGVHGYELWQSDGTPAGTALVRDIVPGTDPSLAGRLTPGNDGIFFTARIASGGPEGLWFTDGTAAGTRIVRTIHPTGGALMYVRLFHRGRLWFTADDGVHGEELWTSDGTANGTAMVKDIRPGAAGSTITSLAPLGDDVVFAANDGTNGMEPWRSDGTPAGTALVRDIDPGPNSGAAGRTFGLSGARYALFVGRNTATGTELWVTDGTALGTALFQDIAPGVPSSNPLSLVVAGNQVFFSADDEEHGRELWVMPAMAHAVPFGQACARGRLPVIGGDGGPPLPGNAAFGILLEGAPANSAAVLLLGVNRAELPLGSGCFLHVAPILMSAVATTGGSGSARTPLPIPYDLSLFGGRLTAQWLALESGGPVLGQAALTSGLSIVVSY